MDPLATYGIELSARLVDLIECIHSIRCACVLMGAQRISGIRGFTGGEAMAVNEQGASSAFRGSAATEGSDLNILLSGWGPCSR